MRIFLFFLLATTVLAQTTEFQPVATVLEIMELIILPTSDIVFKVAAEAPKDAKGWTVVRNNALMLAESGNLLLMRTPAQDNEVWIRESRALIATSAEAARAAQAGNEDQVLEIGYRIYETCEVCHNKYRK